MVTDMGALAPNTAGPIPNHHTLDLEEQIFDHVAVCLNFAVAPFALATLNVPANRQWRA